MRLLILRRLIAPICALVLLGQSGCAQRDLDRLDVLEHKYPRAFFFRGAEQAMNERRFPEYEDWEVVFERLQGIIGKALEEECQGRLKRNPEFFTRFKQRHPEQVVLLHFNGNARDPRYETENYFPGHWIHRKATAIVADIPAEDGVTTVSVEDVSNFRVNSGRYRTSNDDVALFGITEDGRHDWNVCEQTRLVAIDRANNTIALERGCYGTKPLAFKAGAARAAAHEVEGPWGRNNHLMWFYNFSVHCPRDAEGKTAADRLVDDLAGWFGEGGLLEAFDGLEFDVFFNETRGDTDGDGEVDGGVIDGRNNYGIGTVAFARQLRERMGDDFIIQGDGALGPGGRRSQRAWGILNGIESEGFPNLHDWDFEDWSGGLNRHFFWRDNAREPVFNYVNHKWNQGVPGKPGVSRRPDVDWGRHRLVMAACQFFDGVVTFAFAPPSDEDGKMGVWDELRKGVEDEVAWLGRPTGPPVRLAERRPDLLAGRDLTAMIGGGVDVNQTPDGVLVTAKDPGADNLRFAIKDIPADGADLYVAVEMTGLRRSGYPPEMARFADVSISGGAFDLMVGPPVDEGMKLRGADSEVPIDKATGARLQRRTQKYDGQKMTVFFTHPPYKGAKGYTYWTREVDVPDNVELQFQTAMGELSPERSDGVWFKVYAAEVSNDFVGEYAQIHEFATNKTEPQMQRVSLDDYAGKRVRLKFVADCGPKDDATTDHAAWVGARLVEKGVSEDQITPATKYMTWVNEKPFKSTFYFHQVRSDKVSLNFVIQGPEAVTIRSVTAHAHPDAMVREFENGIVLANPDRDDYTFDLGELSPGRAYRRIQATPRQDTETNNGEPVGDAVTLGPLDALFLARR